MKNVFTTIALVGILVLGSTVANAGLLVSDFAPTTTNPCSEQTTKQGTGILVSTFTGILVSTFTGILVSTVTAPANCTATNGFGGLLVSD